jgi:2-polyprenyl-3-methyl-5-hydroxy-6-metoxy-1,4-benzoquinol methylase
VSYQDDWINGKVVKTGERECAERYEVVRNVAAQYSRPITVLDLGANRGYFSVRLAETFGAVCVMFEKRSGLESICHANPELRLIAFKRKMSVSDLMELANTEHFDVVLGLNVFHHFRDSVAAFEQALKLGECLVVETPSLEDSAACGQRSVKPILKAIDKSGACQIGEAPSHVTPSVKRPIYLIRRSKPELARTCFQMNRIKASSVRRHRITSTLRRKSIAFKNGEDRTWFPGINLWTWANLGGVYPSIDEVESMMRVEFALHPDHPDIRPWNFILQGDCVKLIDGFQPKRHGGLENLERSIGWVRNPSQAYYS